MEAVLIVLVMLVMLAFAMYRPSYSKHEKIKATLHKALDLLEAHDIHPTIFYGTLLGWYREGDIIKGDQDADLIIFDPDFDKLSNIKGVQVLNGALARVFSDSGEYVDLYHAVIEDDPTPSVRILTGDASCVSIPIDLVLPLKTDEFLGRKVSIPAKPYEWLRFQYGDDFMTPKDYKGKTCP